MQAIPAPLGIGRRVPGATAGSILFAGASGVLAQDNANLKWGTAAGQGLTAKAGTAASAVSAFELTQTWNYAAAAIQGVDWTFTDTSSHASTNAFRIRGGAAGTTELFRVKKDGGIVAGDNSSINGIVTGGGSQALRVNIISWNGGVFGFSSGASVTTSSSGDSGLSRISAGVIGVGTGAAGNSAGTIQCKHNSSDGSAGVSGTGTTVTCKDGIITAIS